MAEGIFCLRQTLESLALATWADIDHGRQLGVPMGETGITHRNMLALKREHPSLVVYKHSAHEEVRTGADWEWWLRTSDGWICLVFQAKVLNAKGRYHGVTKATRDGKRQVDSLLNTCHARSERVGGPVWPLYCFYNSWPGDWPDGVLRFDLANPRTMAARDLQLFGCAVTDASTVLQILTLRRYGKRRTLRDSYLPVSRPWSLLFPDPAEAEGYKPAQSLLALSSWRYGKPVLEAPTGSGAGPPPGPPSPPSPEGEGPEPTPEDHTNQHARRRSPRRDRQVIYRDPSLIQHTPDYVFDLLESTPGRPRRLKPIARSLIVLP
jgi:hypothetical protein